MKDFIVNSRPFAKGLMLLVSCVLVICSSVFNAPAEDGQSGVAGLSREEALRLGERIYREGILPDGKPVLSIVEGDITVEGTMFSCVSCHMRSGLGSYEGEVTTTPTNGKNLYQPRYADTRRFDPPGKKDIPSYLRAAYAAPPRRPAYTDKTLAVALRDGIDPAGIVLNHVMPRYELNDRDMAILINYLKSLSSEPSPGVTKTEIRFATVVTDEVGAKERKTMLQPLENYVRGHNSRAKAIFTRTKYGVFAEEMDLAYRKMALDVWELKGPPETWRGQLEGYLRKEPVFALLGGITTGEWKPIHEFCENNRIPCLFPITDFPVISDKDWYTIYFSKGYYQEGDAAARFLRRSVTDAAERKVVQIYEDTKAGKALAQGFEKEWSELGHRPPVNRILRSGETVTKELLDQLYGTGKPDVILLWLGSGAIPAIKAVSESGKEPEKLLVSSTLLKNQIWDIPDEARDFTFITYPYRLPPLHNKRSPSSPAHRDNNTHPFLNDQFIAIRMYYLSMLLTETFMDMKSNFYRDYFLDAISMMNDMIYPDHPNVSFGPGQRYASKGCYVVQLAHGANPAILKKSDWVIH